MHFYLSPHNILSPQSPTLITKLLKQLETTFSNSMFLCVWGTERERQECFLSYFSSESSRLFSVGTFAPSEHCDWLSGKGWERGQRSGNEINSASHLNIYTFSQACRHIKMFITAPLTVQSMKRIGLEIQVAWGWRWGARRLDEQAPPNPVVRSL